MSALLDTEDLGDAELTIARYVRKQVARMAGRQVAELEELPVEYDGRRPAFTLRIPDLVELEDPDELTRAVTGVDGPGELGPTIRTWVRPGGTYYVSEEVVRRDVLDKRPDPLHELILLVALAGHEARKEQERKARAALVDQGPDKP